MFLEAKLEEENANAHFLCPIHQYCNSLLIFYLSFFLCLHSFIHSFTMKHQQAIKQMLCGLRSQGNQSKALEKVCAHHIPLQCGAVWLVLRRLCDAILCHPLILYPYSYTSKFFLLVSSDCYKQLLLTGFLRLLHHRGLLVFADGEARQSLPTARQFRLLGVQCDRLIQGHDVQLLRFRLGYDT